MLRLHASYTVDVTLQGIHCSEQFMLHDIVCMDKVATHKNPTKADMIRITELARMCDVNLPVIENDEIDILIGVDYDELLDVFEIRRSNEYKIAAKLTRLGWVLMGHLEACSEPVTGLKPASCTTIHANFCNLRPRIDNYALRLPSAVCNGDANTCELLHAEVKGYFYDEFELNVDDEDDAPSVDDMNCSNIYESSVTKLDNRYFVKLPLKDENCVVPNNRVQAKSRLLQQKKMMENNAELLEFYADAVQKLIDTDKLELVTTDSDDCPERAFYIPHFVTRQAKKRLVYDGSARFNNVSLNSMLYKGSDNLQRLCDVLIRFRRFPIAVSCDIKEMFLQCGIHECDRDLLRILWFKDNNIDNEIVEYRFKRLPFGLNCSMSMAEYCLKKTAVDNQTGASEKTVEAVNSSFYVDDGLISCCDLEEGKQIISEMIELLQSGGFELKKFVAENAELLKDIESDRILHRGESKNLCDEHITSCKVLGIKWNPDNRTIAPKVDIKQRPETKRGLWATVAQIFDPLGICAPYLLPGRQILQQVCEEVKGWDDAIPPDLLKRWYKWLRGLPCLELLEIPRCYWDANVDVYELHTFCDSSEKGLGCVAYLRMISNGDINVAFVMGKAKVVPIGVTLSIPRLELMAALLGSKMQWQIKRSINLPLANCCLYTDSSVVMDWLNNTQKRLKKWVARKITEIHRLCDNDTWHKVPTAQNVADLCSRGIDPRKASPKCAYLTGPSFLYEANLRLAIDKHNATEQRSGKTASHNFSKADCVNDVDLNACDYLQSFNIESDRNLSHVGHVDCGVSCDMSNDSLCCEEACIANNNNVEVINNADATEPRGSCAINEICDVGVPEYIALIAENNSNYWACVKMIAYRYRYVVHKLHQKGLKTNVVLETA